MVDDAYLARLASGSSKKLLPGGSSRELKDLPPGLPPGMPPKRADSSGSMRVEQRAEEERAEDELREPSPYYQRARPPSVAAPPADPRAAALLRARQHKAGSSPALSTQPTTSPEKPLSPVANPAAMARARSGNTNVAGGALPSKPACPPPAKKSESWSQRVEEARLREQRRASAAAAKSAASPPAAGKADAGAQEVQRRAQEVQSWLDQPEAGS